MEQTALATRDQTTALAPSPYHHLAIPGLEDLTLEEDVLLARWRTCQPSSTIEGAPGEFNNNITGELRNELDLIVLKVTPSRAYFSDERKLLCSSRNGRFSNNGKPCHLCPLAQWGPENEPPLCSRGYTLICIDPENDTLCLVGALKTSVPPVKLWFSKLHDRKRSPFTDLTRFTTLEQMSPKGRYFILQLESHSELTPDQQAQAYQYYQSLATINIVEVEDPSYTEPEGPPLFDDDEDIITPDEEEPMPF